MDPYVPIPAADVNDYDSTLDALSAVDDEINYSTGLRVLGRRRAADVSVACTVAT